MSLITLQEAKDYLGITGTDEDNFLEPIVNMVNDYVEKYVGRKLEATDYDKELYDGPGTNALVLRNFPIISVSEVLERTDEVESATVEERTDEYDAGYYILNADEGILYRDVPWTRGRGVIEVSYRAGYETIPNDLKWACLSMAEYLRNIYGKAGINAESLGSYGYSLDTGMSQYGVLSMPRGGAKDVLDFYKRMDTGLNF